eukprot:TRINITY_DN32755_c0_g4_i1.p1 TRINITY_DN32755_c0_g4~~TRINITY_DN32755_c0_g4_i1.p1  ORF type:complete len:743 (-),score=109.89 TRINITY_DN32755_c0_g4_i1:828-3056(-)
MASESDMGAPSKDRETDRDEQPSSEGEHSAEGSKKEEQRTPSSPLPPQLPSRRSSKWNLVRSGLRDKMQKLTEISNPSHSLTLGMVLGGDIDPRNPAFLDAALHQRQTESALPTPMACSPKFSSRQVSLDFKTDSEEELENAVWNERMNILIKKGIPLFFVIFVFPLIARQSSVTPDYRCAIVLMSVVILSLWEILPLFCIGLFVPVLGSLCAVFGTHRTMADTSTLMITSFFNCTSFLILGSLAINAVFTKCGIMQRMMSLLLRKFHLESAEFQLAMMFMVAITASVVLTGSVVVLAALKPLLEASARKKANVPAATVKRLLLGTCFAANIGSILLPTSNASNLILVSMLYSFDIRVSFADWVIVALPVVLVSTFLGAKMLMLFYATSEETDPGDLDPTPKALAEAEAIEEDCEPMKPTDYFFAGCAFIGIIGMTAAADLLEPITGHPACVALACMVLFFGTGFLTKGDLLQLEWDVMCIVGGSNVMALCVRETALGATMSKLLATSGVFDMFNFVQLIVLLTFALVLISTLITHSLCAVIFLPLLVAVGVKLHAAEIIGLLCLLIIPFGMGMNTVSFDNIASQTTSEALGRKSCELTQGDYFKSGGSMSVIGLGTILTLGLGIELQRNGWPEPISKTSKERTPYELEPKVVKENTVNDFVVEKSKKVSTVDAVKDSVKDAVKNKIEETAHATKAANKIVNASGIKQIIADAASGNATRLDHVRNLRKNRVAEKQTTLKHE